jgi:hypothetical protein
MSDKDDNDRSFDPKCRNDLLTGLDRVSLSRGRPA